MILSCLWVLSKASNLVPRRLLHFWGDCIGWLWFFVIPLRRRVVIENLTLAFGTTLSESEIRRLARRNFEHYGRSLLEIFQSISWTRKQFTERVIVEGVENLDPFIREGKGGFLLSGHLGNWEFAVCAPAALGLPVGVVVKRARNPRVEKLFQWYRKRMGTEVLIETGTAREILRSINKGRFIGFVYDQFMGPPIGLRVNFFGKPAGTPVALALLTEKRDNPVIPCYSYRDPQGRNHTIFGPPIQFPKLSADKDQRLFEKTQMFNDILEGLIRQHPEQWLWLHRRWKEYRGEPRWVARTAESLGVTVVPLLLWLGLGGAVASGVTPTGIAIPPDKPVQAPQYKIPVVNEDGEEVKNSKSRTTQAIAPSAVVLEGLPSHKVPFEIGERQELDLNWMALAAGHAVLEVKAGPEIAGRPTFHLWGNLLSSKLVDMVYHVDNTIETFIDRQGLVPYKFLLSMFESVQKKETRVNFDHTQKKAFYWSKRVSKKWGDQDIDRSDEFLPGARDMFSALYYARVLNYTLNQTQTYSVYENGKGWTVELTPIANEFVNTKAGAFQCWKLKVNAHVTNVLQPVGDVFMWLSDDSKKYLVKFEAKVKIGALYGTLVSVRERQ